MITNLKGHDIKLFLSYHPIVAI